MTEKDRMGLATVTIARVKTETPAIRTFVFDESFPSCSRPVRDGLGARRG